MPLAATRAAAAQAGLEGRDRGGVGHFSVPIQWRALPYNLQAMYAFVR
jgi:hypothetical protein